MANFGWQLKMANSQMANFDLFWVLLCSFFFQIAKHRFFPFLSGSNAECLDLLRFVFLKYQNF